MVKGAAPCLRRRIAEARPGRVGLAAAVRSQWEKRLADSRQEWFVEMAKPSKPGEKNHSGRWRGLNGRVNLPRPFPNDQPT